MRVPSCMCPLPKVLCTEVKKVFSNIDDRCCILHRHDILYSLASIRNKMMNHRTMSAPPGKGHCFIPGTCHESSCVFYLNVIFNSSRPKAPKTSIKNPRMF